MRSSRKITLVFTLILIGLTVSQAQAQLKESVIDTTLNASEFIISEEMLRNALTSRSNTFNQNQSFFDKPVTRVFLGLGKSIIGNKVDAPRSYSGFSPENTSQLYYGYRIYERTNEFPIVKRSYGLFRSDF